VRYGTKRRDWQQHLDQPSLNRMELPPEVAQGGWDLILVDGPAGWDDDQTPGRMESIYQAARLVKIPGQVFVHDCNREVEARFSDRFLGPANLVQEIRSSEGFLHHYQIEGPLF
jgi:IRX15/IRX15L/GXM